MIRRRLAKRMGALALRSWDSYREELLSNPREAAHVHTLLTVSISRFWRNRALFDQLRKFHFPALMNCLGEDEPVVVWSAGAASGQEAFSLSMLYHSLPERIRGGRKLTLVASDIDFHLLRRGQENKWTAGEVREVPCGVAEQFLWIDELGAHLSGVVRTEVLFVCHDLFEPPPLRQAHVVFCRNSVMTYFHGPSREQAMARISQMIPRGGYLILGRKETLPKRWAARWSFFHTGHRIYQKIT